MIWPISRVSPGTALVMLLRGVSPLPYPMPREPETMTDAADDKPEPLDAQALARLRELDPDGRQGVVQRVLTAFDTSLALEFMGFAGPDVREGVASLRERRAPRYGVDG